MNKNTINMLLDPNVFNSKLISLVKEFPEIYNTKYKGYKELFEKANSWITISQKLDNTPTARVKKRWRSLRTEFVRNYRNSKPQRYGNAMNFILPFIAKNRRPQLSLDDEEVGSEEDIAMLPDTKEIQNRLSLDSGGPSLNITNHLIDDPTIDLFFQTMAATLKTLPKQTQAQVKADIFQIISKAEIASFSNG